MRTPWLASALLGVAVLAHASVTNPKALPKDHQQQIDNAEESIDQGVAYLRDDNSDAASTALDTAIRSSAFADLPASYQQRALVLSGLIAFEKKDYATAHDQMKRATSIDSPDLIAKLDETAWNYRFQSAYYLENNRDGALSIIHIAQHWPTAIKEVNRGVIYQIDRGIKGKDADLERDYLQALADINWDDDFNASDSLWRDLALLWLRQGDVQKAIQVSQRIKSARIVVAMLVDKRFDPITQANHFDIDQIIDKQLASAKAAVAAAPDKLQPVTVLQGLLLDTHHYAEALSVSDAAIAKAGGNGGAKAYTDFDDSYVWVLDNRARTLVALGRWDDAVTQWQHAARRPEQGAMNVSQVINLADFYTILQRPKDALDTLTDLGEMSPFGRMQLEGVKLKAAVEQNDKAAISVHLDYLRDHRADAISAWQEALIVTNNMDAATDLLVERLANEAWRSEALVDMQDYLDSPGTPFATEEMRRWKAIVAEPKVQSELAKVGRIEHFNLDPEQN